MPPAALLAPGHPPDVSPGRGPGIQLTAPRRSQKPPASPLSLAKRSVRAGTSVLEPMGPPRHLPPAPRKQPPLLRQKPLGAVGGGSWLLAPTPCR